MIIEQSPAKLNLCLEIVGRLENGYHSVKSLMQSLSLCDTVRVEKGDGIRVSCSDPRIPLDESNLAAKGAAAFFAHTGIKGGAVIEIDKRIPVGAGLGGGSSNCGAVLRALNRLYGTGLSEGELCSIGAPLGADVAFCTLGGSCFCEGVGDVLTPMNHQEIYYVLCFGKVFLSTPDMYGRFDNGGGGKADAQGFLRLWQAGDLNGAFAAGGNSFYPIAAALDPAVEQNTALLKQNGAFYASISGKGPTVFGAFENEVAARAAAEAVGGVFCKSVAAANIW